MQALYSNISPFTFHLGFVHPLQDVSPPPPPPPMPSCTSVYCLPVSGASLLLCSQSVVRTMYSVSICRTADDLRTFSHRFNQWSWTKIINPFAPTIPYLGSHIKPSPIYMYSFLATFFLQFFFRQREIRQNINVF